MLVVDVVAQPDDVELLGTERASELRPGIVVFRCSIELVESKTVIYQIQEKSNQDPRGPKKSLPEHEKPTSAGPHRRETERWVGGASNRRSTGSRNRPPWRRRQARESPQRRPCRMKGENGDTNETSRSRRRRGKIESECERAPKSRFLRWEGG